MEHKISYSYRPPGFSIAEIVQDRKRIEFSHVKFDRSIIQELITALEGEGVLEKITVIDNEIRYRVSDYRLHRLLKESWKLYHEVIEAFMYLWFDIRTPSPDEKKWLKLVYGNKADGYRKLEQMFAKMFYERASVKEKRKKQETFVQDINQLFLYLYEDFETLRKSHGSVIQKYGYLIEKLLEYLFPRFMRKWFVNQSGKLICAF